MAERYSAFGAQFQIGSTAIIASAVYTTVASVTNIDPPDQITNMIKVSAHDDATRHDVYRAGRVDSGETTIEGFLDPVAATHIGSAGLQGLRDAGTLRAFKIIYPDVGAMDVAFLAIVTQFKAGPLAHDGAIEFSATVKVSGAAIYTL